MVDRRWWLRRNERKAAGEVVSIEQVDGTTKTFPATDFHLGLFVAATNAATGVVPEGAVADAMTNATPAARARIEAMAASGQGGDFLRRVMDCDGGLLEVGDEVEDLSAA